MSKYMREFFYNKSQYILEMRFSAYIFSLLRRHKIRYIACIIGLSVAVASIFTMSAYSDSLDKTINKFFLVDRDVIIVNSKESSIIQIVPVNSIVNESVRNKIYEDSSVRMVIPMIFKEFSERIAASYLTDMVVGINFDLLKLYLGDIPIKEGRFPEKNAHEIIVGPSILDGNVSLGQNISIQGDTFKVVGILESDNIIFNHFIYADYSTIQDLYDMEGFCTIMYVIFDREVLIQQDRTIGDLSDYIESLDPSIKAMDSDKLKEESGNFFAIIRILQLFMTIVPFIISIIMVFVLMMLNVKDQQREYGVLSAIGASKWNLFSIILYQALFLILFGVLFGIVLGYFYFALSFNQINTAVVTTGNSLRYAFEMAKKIPASIYRDTILSSLGIGVLVSFYPAYLASKSNIVKMFRYE